MLQAIRDHVTGWFAYIIVALLIIPFAFWGLNHYLDGGQESYVAKVNDTAISPYVLDTHVARESRQYEETGQQAPGNLKQQVLERLINTELLAQFIQEQKMFLTKAELIKEIVALFSQEGTFSEEQYKRFVESQGYTQAGFEAAFQNELLLERLQASIIETALLNPKVLEDFIALDRQTRKISYIELPLENYTKDIVLTDTEIEEYYQSHIQDYAKEEEVIIEYIEIDLAEIAQDIPVEEAIIKSFYEEQKANFSKSETRMAKHILLTLDPSATAEQEQAVVDKIQDIAKQIQQGADFAEMAKTYSQDPGSSFTGGDLGEVSKGQMVKEFEDALFSLEENVVSEPVKTQFGYHLILVEKINKANMPSFEDVKTALTEQYQMQAADTVFFDKVEELANLAYENPDDLSYAAEILQLPLKTTDKFTRSQGDGIAEHAVVRNAAFSFPVLQDKNNSDLVEITSQHIVVLRVKEHFPSTTIALEQVKEAVKQAAIEAKAKAAMLAQAEQLLEQLPEQQDIKAWTEQQVLNYHEPEEIQRNNFMVAADIVEKAFDLPHPKENVVFEGFESANKNYIIVILHQVTPGDYNALEEEEKEMIKQAFAFQQGQKDFALFVEILKSQAKIKIAE